MKKNILMFIFIIIISILTPNIIAEETITSNENKETINVYFFGTSTCPYCKDEKLFFEEHVKENTDVKVYYYELDKVRDNAKLLLEFGDAFNERTTSVPITFISDKSWIGFSEGISIQMETLINQCREKECTDSFDLLENNSKLKKYITDKKYFEFLGAEKEKKESVGFFKKIILFFKNLF
jgi:glutaredoxin